MAKSIKLTRGKYAIVDDADFEWLNQYGWYAHKDHNRNCYYAIRSERTNRKRHTVCMHRQILGLMFGDGILTDHKNSNGLDNQRHNLRKCSQAENVYNCQPIKGKASKFKGVTWSNGVKYKNKQYEGKWRANIYQNYKHISLGLFDDEIEAARTYDHKAKELFGKFALLNFNQGNQNYVFA